MFFIIGVSPRQKQLDFDQVIACPRCGHYGHLSVFLVCQCLTFFFIPIFKWGKRYYVTASCCNTSVELDEETGRGIERGEIRRLPEDIIPAGSFGGSGSGYTRIKRCANCGYTTEEDFTWCPKCGNRL